MDKLVLRFGHRRVADARRYAMKYDAALPQLLLVGLMFVPQLAHAQSCEWERFAEPSAGAEVIEVHRHGGYGPPAGRTLVSVDASGRIAVLARGQCPDQTLVGVLATPAFADLVREFRTAVEAVRNDRIEARCASLSDGVDLDVTLYRDGSKEHYACVRGPLLRFGEGVLNRVFDAICTNRTTTVCVRRLVDPR
jgi:hypothetical protein